MSEILDQIAKDGKKPDLKTRESMYEKMWTLAVAGRKYIERQMQINTSYYLGNQWIGWDKARNTVLELKAPAHRLRTTDNLLLPKVRAKMSRQMNRPGVQVLPEGSQDIDIKRSKVKERALMHVERENNMELIRQQMSLWAAVCGDAFPHVSWDEKLGDIYGDEEGLHAEGEVKIGMYSPWEVWEDPTAKQGTWGRYCFTARLFPIEQITSEYAKELKAAGIDNLVADGEEYTNKYARANMFGFFDETKGGAEGTGKRDYEDMVLVKTMYIFASAKYPEGQECVIINNRIVEEGPLEWFPLVHYANMLSFDRFRGDTELRHAIQPQKSYNRARSNIEEFLRIMKGKVISHKENKLQSSSPNSEHGEVLEYEGSQPAPTFVSPPALAATVWQNLEIIKATIDDIFADRPVSQGRSEHSGQPFAAIEALQEQDDRLHIGGVGLYERALQEVYQKCLELLSQKYSHGRKITVVGDDMKADIDEIDRGEDGGEDLLAGSNKVYISLGSSLPKNKSARNQMVLAYHERGLYGDPADPITNKKVLKMLDAGVVDDVFDDDKLDENNAAEENKRLEAGEMVAIAPWENHVIHIKGVERFMKGPEYRNADEEVEKNTIMHWGEHMNALAASMPQTDEQGNPITEPATAPTPGTQGAPAGTAEPNAGEPAY